MFQEQAHSYQYLLAYIETTGPVSRLIYILTLWVGFTIY